jgi:hypothetical protein
MSLSEKTALIVFNLVRQPAAGPLHRQWRYAT